MFIRHNYLLLPVSSRKRIWVPSKEAPIHVVDGFMWNPYRERFEDVRGATYTEIVASLGITQLVGFGAGGVAFTPVTNTYTTGSGTETAPGGAASVTLTSVGGGGGGRVGTGGASIWGGGGGGACVSTIASPSGTLGYSVGAAGVGRTPATSGDGTSGGTSSTSAGTGSFTGITHSAGGGASTTTPTGGAASGGTTNTAGVDGTVNTSGTGGASGTGAAGGFNSDGVTLGTVGTAPGGGGGGGLSTVSHVGRDGGAGRITFAYT